MSFAIDQWTEALEEMRQPARAQPMSAYMRHQFTFYGVPAAQRQYLIKKLKHAIPANRQELLDLVVTMWNLPQREYQYIAILLLQKKINLLYPEDIYLIGSLIKTKSWWDSVDALSINVAGSMLREKVDLRAEVIKAWTEDDARWLNRAAILLQIKYKMRTDRGLLIHAIEPHIESEWFFHQKAIGWALRAYSKVNAPWVKAVLSTYDLQPLSLREASKYLE